MKIKEIVTSVRSKRVGLPISAKLIFATSLVVAVALAVTTFFSQRTMTQLAQSNADARRISGERAIKRESDLMVKAVATAVALPLASSTYSDIAPLLLDALHDDQQRGDRRLEWLLITDAENVIVQSTPGAPTVATLGAVNQQLLASAPAGELAQVGIVRALVTSQTSQGSHWVYGTNVNVADRVVGTLRMGVSTAGLEAELALSIADAQTRAQASRQRVWLLAIAVLLGGVVLAFFQGVQLAKPIRALTKQAERIASGDLEQRVPTNRSDELGVLATSFNFMSDQLKALLAEQAQKVSLEKEMSLARMVQQSMLPSTALDTHGFMKVAGYCMPASSCGGDWWTYRKLSNGRMLFVLGDATGHGIHSAMIAATARGAVEGLSSIDERLLTPDQVLRAIDSAIRDVGDHNVLMTAFAALFDSNHGVLHYANAGQNFPYIVRVGDNRLLEDASIIAAAGNPLGDRSIQVEIRRGSKQLHPGDVFVCFSDGLVERANKAGKLFGDRRLRMALKGQAVPDGPALVAVRDRVLAVVETYAEGVEADDDITFVLCQYDPPAASAQRPIDGAISGAGAA
ncbi:MAG: SpoIIE family protein phosphatase [Kofleriaceae bacterium]|nr:SpoIIE family protein phosphatase [Kofleriaceae bacterium]